jgi:hypothetical protein|eukprot:scaffold567_cov230-Alexandrium_tamarense.AAC.4
MRVSGDTDLQVCCCIAVGVGSVAESSWPSRRSSTLCGGRRRQEGTNKFEQLKRQITLAGEFI